jgi:hypothetical protein
MISWDLLKGLFDGKILGMTERFKAEKVSGYIAKSARMFRIDPHNIFNNKNLEILQFTGLYDRYRVEIYKGDILRTYNGIGVVKFNPPWFYVTGEYPEVFASCANEWEVVGNIYENPELLEV